MPNPTRLCRLCQQHLPLDAFYATRRVCKRCICQQRRERYHSDPLIKQKQIQAAMTWAKTHKRAFHAICTRYQKKRRQTDPVYRAKINAYQRARYRRQHGESPEPQS